MASFLDNLAASWGSGYNVDEYARRRAMNDALMNLGTTLMMAGGSGSWRAAAPMLAQAIPSAYGTFKGSVSEAQQLAERQEEKEWQEKQRAFIEEERRRVAEERKEAEESKKNDEMAQWSLLTEQRRRAAELAERGKTDPDVDPAEADALMRMQELMAQNFGMTRDPRAVTSLTAAVSDFGTKINQSEVEKKKQDLEDQIAASTYGMSLEEYRKIKKSSLLATASGHQAAASNRADAAADERAKLIWAQSNPDQAAAGGWQVVDVDGKQRLIQVPVARSSGGQDERIQKELFDTSVGMLQPLWGQSKTPGEAMRFSHIKKAALSGTINPAKYNPLTGEQLVVEQVATALGVPPPTTPEEVKALFTLASNPQAAYTHIQGRIFGQAANNPTTSGVASFAPGSGATPGIDMSKVKPVTKDQLSPSELVEFNRRVAGGQDPNLVLKALAIHRHLTGR